MLPRSRDKSVSDEMSECNKNLKINCKITQH